MSLSCLRIARASLAVVIAVSALTASAQAGTGDAALLIELQKLDDGHRVIARNDSFAPVTAEITLTGDNLGLDHPSPLRVVVPAKSAVKLAHAFPADPRRPYRLQTHAEYRLGDEGAIPDAQAEYRLPFAEGQGATVLHAFSDGSGQRAIDELLAVEFGVATGTPVVAARDGRVVALTADSVVLLQPDGTLARYAHVVAAPELAAGQAVAAGAPLGAVHGGAGDEGALQLVVQRTQRTPDGINAVALPINFYAYNPPQRVVAQRGELLTADYTHPFVPKAAPAPKAVTPTPGPLLHPTVWGDKDRATVRAARAAESPNGTAPAPVARREPSLATVLADRWAKTREVLDAGLAPVRELHVPTWALLLGGWAVAMGALITVLGVVNRRRPLAAALGLPATRLQPKQLVTRSQ